MAGALILTACDDANEEPPRLLDAAAPPPPGPCVITKSAVSFCDGGPSALAPSDAGADPGDASADAGEGGATDGGKDAAAPASPIPDTSENRCLVTADTTIACPSYVGGLAVGEGKGGATDLLVSQLGLARYASATNASLVADEQAHVSHIRVASEGVGAIAVDPVPPFDAKATPPAAAVAVLPTHTSAARDAHLVSFQASGETSAFATGPLGGGPVALGAPFGVPVAVPFTPVLLTMPSGEGIWVAQPRGASGPNGQPLLIVRGLPEAPRVVPTAVAPDFFVARVSPAGEPAGLFYDGQTLRLLQGETFGTEVWSRPLERGANIPTLDLAWLGATPAVLTRSGSAGDVMVRFTDNAPEAGGTRLGESFSTCSRASYLGITCDACPVDRSCETGEDAIGEVRLWSSGGRLFAAFLATDVRRRMGYARSVIPILGVGCTCTLEEREKKEFADSLVVVEIVRTPNEKPGVVERMRLPLYKARSTGFVSLTPRSTGELDVVVGPGLHRFDEALGKLPEKPAPYRLLRIATGL